MRLLTITTTHLKPSSHRSPPTSCKVRKQAARRQCGRNNLQAARCRITINLQNPNTATRRTVGANLSRPSSETNHRNNSWETCQKPIGRDFKITTKMRAAEVTKTYFFTLSTLKARKKSRRCTTTRRDPITPRCSVPLMLIDGFYADWLYYIFKLQKMN